MNIKGFLKNRIQEVVKDIYGIDFPDFVIEIPPKEDLGDFSTNVALAISKLVKKTPMEVGSEIYYGLEALKLDFEFSGKKYPLLQSITVVNPGFINVKISDIWLKINLFDLDFSEISYTHDMPNTDMPFQGKKVMVEYTDPNPFKVIHIGHLMSNCIGESVARLIAYQGAIVKKANYQGDVGIHVAKSIWGMKKLLDDRKLTLVDLEKKDLVERVKFLGEAYALGAQSFEEDTSVKDEITNINYLIYVSVQRHLKEIGKIEPQIDYAKQLDTLDESFLEEIKSLYSKGRLWSLEYFETIYEKLGTKFDHYFFESFVGEYGVQKVNKLLGLGVFEESDGAVVFKAEKYGLHTRVFINSKGLPTYEAKELGLASEKFKVFPYDLSIVITANEIVDYFKVLLKALEFSDPDLAKVTKHLSHGMMRLKSGKMSSRTGKVIAGDELIDKIKEEVLHIMSSTSFVTPSIKDDTAEKVAVSSIKYSVLKQGMGQDIVFDEDKALSLTGDTGPYLLYTYARATSVLIKSGFVEKDFMVDLSLMENVSLHPSERSLATTLIKFEELAVLAGSTFSPSIIAGFTYDLAQKFNSFYNEVPILSDSNVDTKKIHLIITRKTCQVLKSALDLLGISVVDKM